MSSGRRCGRPGRLAAAVLASSLLAGACSSGSDGATEPDTAPVDHTLRLGMTEPATLDPAAVLVTERSELIAVDLLFDGLTSVENDGRVVVGAIADSWNVSGGQTVWTFALREDARFSDGTRVTSKDVKASLERVVAAGEESLAGTRLEMVKGYDPFVAGKASGLSGVVAVDDHTVRITTSEPYSLLPQVLGSPSFGIVPASAVDKGDEFFTTPVGSGPLTLASRTRERMVLKPAADRDLNVDEVDLVLFDDPEGAYEAYAAGEVDWSLVPSGRVTDAIDQHGAYRVPYHAELFFGFNLSDATFAKRDFREAIVRGVDRAKLVTDRFDLAEPLDGLVVHGVPGARKNACGETCAYDPKRAKALVKKAYPSGKVPTVRLDYYEGEREQAVAEDIRADLKEVGIPVKLRPRPASAYDRFVVSGDQGMFLFGWPGIAPTADSYLAPLFLTGSADNVTGFSALPVDAGIAAARAFDDGPPRASAYAKVEDAVLASLPVMPLAQFQTAYVLDNRVVGFAPRLDGTFAIETVRLVG